MSLVVEKNLAWEPAFRNEITIIDKRKMEDFTITLKEGNMEIEYTWDYGWGGRGAGSMDIPIQMLKDLILELEQS